MLTIEKDPENLSWEVFKDNNYIGYIEPSFEDAELQENKYCFYSSGGYSIQKHLEYLIEIKALLQITDLTTIK